MKGWVVGKSTRAKKGDMENGRSRTSSSGGVEDKCSG